MSDPSRYDVQLELCMEIYLAVVIGMCAGLLVWVFA